MPNHNENQTHQLKQIMRLRGRDFLTERQIGFVERNGGAHLIVEGPDCFIDYWPGTGKWISRDGQRGFGAQALASYVTQTTTRPGIELKIEGTKLDKGVNHDDERAKRRGDSGTTV